MDRSRAGLPREFVADASGRVLFKPEGWERPQLRVPVYSSPRPASVMTQPSSLDMPSGSIQSASLPLSGTGVDQGSGSANGTLVQSLVAGFELQATSGALPGIPERREGRRPEVRRHDVLRTGARSSIGDNDAIADGEEYFAISDAGPVAHRGVAERVRHLHRHERRRSPGHRSRSTRGSTGTDVLVDETIDLNSGDVVDDRTAQRRLGDTDTALFDSDTLVMPVWLGALAEDGLTTDASRITYGVLTFGQFSVGSGGQRRIRQQRQPRRVAQHRRR